MLKSIRRRLAAVLLAVGLAAAPSAQAQMPAQREAIEQDLKTLPVFAVLAMHYPDVFKAAVDVTMRGMASGRSMRDMQAEIRKGYVGLIKSQMPKAEGTHVLQAARIGRDQAEALAAAPADCMAILGVGTMSRVIQSVLPKAQIEAEQAWAAEMLRQTATRPVKRTIKPPSEEAIQLLAMTAYDALSSDDARQRMGRIGGNFESATDPADQKAVCEFNIHFADAVLAMSTQEGVDMFLGLNYAPTP